MSSQNRIADAADLPCASSLLVYDWFQHQFPGWKFEYSHKQVASSQSLTSATIPELAQGPRGMVHFKSIVEPLWSTGDMASLRARFPWILLVLSPFERFYELSPALDELSSCTPQLIIWRPDRPSVEECARLRVSSLVGSTGFSPSAGSQRGHGIADRDVLELLTALYVQRGTLTAQSVRSSISQGLGALSLARYIAGVLSSCAATVATQTAEVADEAEPLAMRWADLLCRQKESETLDIYDRESQALAWAERYLEGGNAVPLCPLQSMPESFLTTRFREEARFFDAALGRIQQIMRGLRKGDTTFVLAMTQISQIFNGDESRLARWKSAAENLPGFLSWLAGFDRSYGYLCISFPSSSDGLELLRGELLASCAEPHRFLDVRERDAFDSKFDAFKSMYIEAYASAHDDAVHVFSNQERMKTRLDSVALRNFEQLAPLNPAGRKGLSLVHAIAKYLQANQCNLPVREILVHQPRCYCNFHPAASRLLVQSLDRMNAIVKDEIEAFRSALRKSRKLIIRELANTSVEDQGSKPIAALLSRGPMIALEQPALEVLTDILHRHPQILSGDEDGPTATDFARWGQ